MKKKTVAGLLTLCMAAGMMIVPQTAVMAEEESGGKLVGVAMPTKDLQRWNQDGDNMKKSLEDAGYEVDLQYASNDVATQVSQVENMISNGCDILVIGFYRRKFSRRAAEPGKRGRHPGYRL